MKRFPRLRQALGAIALIIWEKCLDPITENEKKAKEMGGLEFYNRGYSQRSVGVETNPYDKTSIAGQCWELGKEDFESWEDRNTL